MEAQASLVAWAEKKIAQCRSELAEAEENLAESVQLKIRTSGWKTQVTRAKERVVYYEKALEALKEGYCIVPDFPVQLISVRTSKNNPPSKVYSGGTWMIPDLKSERLPVGEGENLSPDVYAESWKTDVKDASGNVTRTITHSCATEVREVDFPFKTVKPQILSELSKALKMKLFDEIGILPATPKGDPMIIGKIHCKQGARTQTMSFLVTWWIDTRDL